MACSFVGEVGVGLHRGFDGAAPDKSGDAIVVLITDARDAHAIARQFVDGLHEPIAQHLPALVFGHVGEEQHAFVFPVVIFFLAIIGGLDGHPGERSRGIADTTSEGRNRVNVGVCAHGGGGWLEIVPGTGAGELRRLRGCLPPSQAGDRQPCDCTEGFSPIALAMALRAAWSAMLSWALETTRPMSSPNAGMSDRRSA